MKNLVKPYKTNIPKLIEDYFSIIKHPRKDNLRIIIDLIYTRSQRFKNKTQKAYGFVQIPYSVFINYIPNNNIIKLDIDYLVDNGIIIRNNWFDYNNGEARGYKIAKEYLSSVVKVFISDMKINKRIHDYHLEQREKREKNVQFLKTDFYTSFKIKYQEAIRFVFDLTITGIKDINTQIRYKMNEDEILDLINGEGQYLLHKAAIIKSGAGDVFYSLINRHISYINSIEKINDGYLFFKRNKTNGRLDTNLTSLPSILRPFLVCDSPLYSIDFKSSQPFFLYTEIKDNPSINPDELELYKNLVVSGDSETGLYEFLSEEYKKTNNKIFSRNDAKKMIFKIFYSKNTSFKGLKEFFGKYFPTILRYINSRKVDSHGEFSTNLQNKEAFTVLDSIVPKLKPLDIKPYTIHDSFICKYEDVDVVYNTTVETLKDLYGYCPKLHLDCLTSGAIEDRNDNSEEVDVMDFEEFEFEEYQSDEPSSVTHLPFDKESLKTLLN